MEPNQTTQNRDTFTQAVKQKLPPHLAAQSDESSTPAGSDTTLDAQRANAILDIVDQPEFQEFYTTGSNNQAFQNKQEAISHLMQLDSYNKIIGIENTIAQQKQEQQARKLALGAQFINAQKQNMMRAAKGTVAYQAMQNMAKTEIGQMVGNKINQIEGALQQAATNKNKETQQTAEQQAAAQQAQQAQAQAYANDLERQRRQRAMQQAQEQQQQQIALRAQQSKKGMSMTKKIAIGSAVAGSIGITSLAGIPLLHMFS